MKYIVKNYKGMENSVKYRIKELKFENCRRYYQKVVKLLYWTENAWRKEYHTY